MAKQEIKKTETKPKSKLPTKKYPLIKDVRIRGVLKKIGEKVDLTEKGREHFKQNFLIR
jgi:hypothetical protein